MTGLAGIEFLLVRVQIFDKYLRLVRWWAGLEIRDPRRVNRAAAQHFLFPVLAVDRKLISHLWSF